MKYLKELYKSWNPNNIAHDGNEEVRIELEFIKTKALFQIVNCLEEIILGEEKNKEA